MPAVSAAQVSLKTKAAAPAPPATVAGKQDIQPLPSFANPSTTVFINELHYDDSTAAGDTNEFIEVAGPAGTDLTGWSIVLYNGGGTPVGQTYDTDALSGIIPSQQGGYGTVSITYPTNGIQNGSPDGIALVNGTTVVQFLCYEGTFTASNGPANGMACTDIGVAETNSTAPGSSLHLTGTGTTYGNFTWAVTTANTKNSPNTGQTFTGGPPVDNPPTVQSTTPADNATNIAVNANISVTFNEPVTATTSSFQISCATSGTHAFALSGGPTTYTLDPTVDFTQGEVCTVTVFAAQVTDQDGTPNQMAADYVFDFTVINTAPVAIHTIQGSGASSPIVGSTVSTSGIVTLLKTSANTGTGSAASGFFMQDPNADADPNTSEGIFVFTSSVPTVGVGDEVTVIGTVQEFNGLTELGSVTSVSIIDTSNTLPTPITLTTTILDPTAPPTQPQLEKYEGMRMAAASLKSVAPNDNFYDVYAVLSSVPRPVREPGIPVSDPVPPDPTTGTPDCCIPRFDENPERILLDTNARAGAANVGYTSNVTFTNVSGPLDFSFNQYRLVTDAGFTASANMSAVPVPAPTASEFTVAGFNIENFNNNATQRQKAALAIRTVMLLPDIIGHVEILDLASLQALATQVNNDTVAAGGANPNYQAYLIPAPAGGTQNVGFLVKTSRVQVNSVTQERASDTFVNPSNGQTENLHDRPPLVLKATVEPSGAASPVIVVVNHLRSFIDIELVSGEGPRVRQKRTKQAESVAGLLQELQTNNPATPVISVGDYNAYQFNDGYTDPISILKGMPTADDQIVVDQSPDLVNPNFANLIDELPIDQQYSFIFEGTPQALDHVLVNTVAHARTTRIAIARNDSDFPEVPPALYASNASRPERASDHDMPVGYFSLTGAPPQPVGSVIISEFRFRGPGANFVAPPTINAADSSPEANDEFVEIYNNTDSDITVTTTDGSSGWALVAADGVKRFEIPNNTVIPARGHFLGVNTLGYSLGGYGLNGTVGDATYSEDILDGSGIALFRTSNPTNFTLTERLDAAGYAGVDALYREGTGFATGGGEMTQNLEYSFYRDLSLTGNHKDTGNNLADFISVDTEGTPTGLGQNLGAPGPQNLSSPRQRNAVFPVALLDPSTSQASPENRVRVQRENCPACDDQKSQFGTMSIRRRITNNTQDSISYLRFRITTISTFPFVDPTQADMRALDSPDIVVTINGTPVDVRGTSVEQPPMQPNGGGWNSSMLAGYIDLDHTLDPGTSVNVQFLLGVQQRGLFRFYISVEAGQREQVALRPLEKRPGVRLLKQTATPRKQQEKRRAIE